MEYDLSRFINAQVSSYETALAEVKNGLKVSHWMWYIFPQISGLGHSSTARYYAIKDLGEARAYMADPVLGPRLIEISSELLKLKTNSASGVFGPIDDLKLRSCMTLFKEASPECDVFSKVLDKFYRGSADSMTLSIIGR